MRGFKAVAEEAVALHDKKNKDYGTEADPYYNVRSSQEFGIPAWLGVYIRMNDKMTRVKAFARKGNLENESLRDSLLDLFVYAGIALDLYDEEAGDGA
jgi:hypothetical protein